MNREEKIRIAYEKLSLSAFPFAAREGALENIIQFRQQGLIRRYGAVIDHRQAGFTANAMVCWKLGRDKREMISEALKDFPQVSHCYFRTVYPEWPYGFYTMVHARSESECGKTISSLAKALGNPAHKVLRTVREYKKTRPVVDFSRIKKDPCVKE